MVATLQSRKEALEAKILEKNEELKKLCLQEADLTGVVPPEIPLEPGEPPPTVRRRIGTSFSFPQNLINSIKDVDDESLHALELECKVQTNIAEAALTLANDTTANKAVRKKHRLMYRQSQRRLLELETRLNLLKQGKAQQLKTQQIRKKPRPNTTAVENLGYFWNTNQEQPHTLNITNSGSWSLKNAQPYATDEVDSCKDSSHPSDMFSSLYRSFKSGSISQSSNSPQVDGDNEDHKPLTRPVFSNSTAMNHIMLSSSYSHPNIQDVTASKISSTHISNTSHHKRSPKRGMVRRQWDSQSAGGTLLPNQTYPDHSHQPNLSRTQSLGSVETNSQRNVKDSWSVQDFAQESSHGKEKEWYETSLDSAPSPPLRTSSRLPPAARMHYHAQEVQSREVSDWNTVGISSAQPINSHPVLTRTQNLLQRTAIRGASVYSAPDTVGLTNDDLSNSMQQIHLNSKVRSASMYVEDKVQLNQKEFNHACNQSENMPYYEYSNNIPKQSTETLHHHVESKLKSDHIFYDGSADLRYLQSIENRSISKQSIGNHMKTDNPPKVDEAEATKKYELTETHFNNNIDSVFINIPEDNGELPANVKSWINDSDYTKSRESHFNSLGHSLQEAAFKQAHPNAELLTGPKTPTQPYFHVTKLPHPVNPHEKLESRQFQATKNRHIVADHHQTSTLPPSPNLISVHPPHAITQNEITFDTVVPFESPQNHTVVQAGKWQPYREVTKPFEMSDFYKYSTKFRQNKANVVRGGNRANTPDISRISPNTHHKGIYQPLKPMTCQPVESKYTQMQVPNQMEGDFEEADKAFLEVSVPEIV